MQPYLSRDKTDEWVKQWAKTGPLLENNRRRELREMTDEQRIKAIATVLQIGGIVPGAETISGLVEQQRLFKKARQ
jgi:hypothetical protein